jgi:hypothetical protein
VIRPAYPLRDGDGNLRGLLWVGSLHELRLPITPFAGLFPGSRNPIVRLQKRGSLLKGVI